MNAPATTSGAESGAPLSAQDVELIRLVATNVWESVDDFSVVFARTLHERIPELGGPEDATAAEVTRRSAIGSMHEFLSIMRAGIFAPNAIETAIEALEHVRYLKARGIGLGLALRWYHVGVAMFEPMVNDRFERDAPDAATLERMRALMRQFIFIYVDQVTKRLAAEYGVTEREGWVADPDAPILHDPALAEVTRSFLSGRESNVDGDAAHRHSQEALQRFCAAMRTAAGDPQLSRKLARADTSVRITLADDPDLGVTLLLDRTPIEVVDDDTPAEVDLSIASVDLDRLCSPEFHLAMAIARGRVQYRGNVRKFLRVTPIVRHASLPTLAATDDTRTALSRGLNP
jgi:hypothetical protein